ncbi:SRPBCC family protein [Sinosporangium siamense]|uniref:ATPase n=1 Tax=Sinosporangium siamense TaxID=1367973 RepID=A0A919VCU1_9ACTN|nr:SRPBCC family protein [Sinosporangium siamense]GII93469.1 ATPase [Sinosporangium siamense]
MNDRLQVTTPADDEIMLTRAFDAPATLVFDAWTKPELLKCWHGARGWNLVVCEVDLRVGGAWRFVSRGPDGTEMGIRGVYREVDAPRRLVHTEYYDEQWVAGESVVTHEFVERDGGTTLVSIVRYPSREVRDLALKSPMERGLTESFARLDEVLADR